MLWKYKKCYQETSEGVFNPVSSLVGGILSSTTTTVPEDGCTTLDLDSFIYISQQIPNFITDGDIIYTDATATTTFIGNGEYYKVKAINSAPHIVEVNTFGVVSNPYEVCT
jgi:hypothetical protein